MRVGLACALAVVAGVLGSGQAPVGATLLRPARVFDGEVVHEGWAVRVRGDRIEEAGPAARVSSSDAEIINLPAATLLPGLIEASRGQSRQP